MRDALPTCPDRWSWSLEGKSSEANLESSDPNTVNFHMNWSNGTAGIRGNCNLNDGCIHYWELRLNQRVFGTSMMFGLANKDVKLHRDSFINMFGQDHNSWAISHKGMLWHASECRSYTSAFKENQTTVIGLLYDSTCQTLTYYKDGECLGVAFRGLPSPWSSANQSPISLYPVIASTAAKTSMTLLTTLRTFSTLQERCRHAIISHLPQPFAEVKSLRTYLPGKLVNYIGEAVPDNNMYNHSDLISAHNCPICSKSRQRRQRDTARGAVNK